MLGRGHLSILRQGRGSWPDRESFVSTPVTGREDMVLMDGQLERDSLPDYCPKSRPQKYFSPPKRPWDFSKATQPKRLWDFSPSFCTERLQVNTRSARRIQDPREQCCGSLDAAGAGVCSTTSGIHSSRLSSVRRSCTVRRAESGDDAAEMPPCIGSTCPVGQDSVKQGFWASKTEASSVETGAQNQERSLPPTFEHQVQFLTKAVIADQQSKASQQLSDKVEIDIQEIERLKAQMALLSEQLAWHISRCNSTKAPCKAPGMADSFDSEESILLKEIGELKRVIRAPDGSVESGREQGKDLEAECAEDMCRCRNLAWKSGFNTLFQSFLWCIGFMMTIVRCTHSGPALIPT